MSDETFYLVKVREEFMDEKGKVKKVVKQKLVNAVSVTDSEVKVTGLYRGVTFDWEIISSSLSPIDEIIH